MCDGRNQHSLSLEARLAYSLRVALSSSAQWLWTEYFHALCSISVWFVWKSAVSVLYHRQSSVLVTLFSGKWIEPTRISDGIRLFWPKYKLQQNAICVWRWTGRCRLCVLLWRKWFHFRGHHTSYGTAESRWCYNSRMQNLCGFQSLCIYSGDVSDIFPAILSTCIKLKCR